MTKEELANLKIGDEIESTSGIRYRVVERREHAGGVTAVKVGTQGRGRAVEPECAWRWWTVDPDPSASATPEPE